MPAYETILTVEVPVVISRDELPWVTWEQICIKFGLDPFKVVNILLYCTRVSGFTRQEPDLFKAMQAEKGVTEQRNGREVQPCKVGPPSCEPVYPVQVLEGLKQIIEATPAGSMPLENGRFGPCVGCKYDDAANGLMFDNPCSCPVPCVKHSEYEPKEQP